MYNASYWKRIHQHYMLDQFQSVQFSLLFSNTQKLFRFPNIYNGTVHSEIQPLSPLIWFVLPSFFHLWHMYYFNLWSNSHKIFSPDFPPPTFSLFSRHYFKWSTVIKIFQVATSTAESQAGFFQRIPVFQSHVVGRKTEPTPQSYQSSLIQIYLVFPWTTILCSFGSSHRKCLCKLNHFHKVASLLFCKTNFMT